MHHLKIRCSGMRDFLPALSLIKICALTFALTNSGCGSGSDGERGPTGPVGSPGPTGIQGPIGLEGTQGPPGTQGANGAPGMNGAPGADGAQGSPGANGMNAPVLSVSTFSGIVEYGGSTLIEASVSGRTDDSVSFSLVFAPAGARLDNIDQKKATFVAPVSPQTQNEVTVIVRIASKAEPSLFRDISIVLPGRGGVAGIIE